MSIKETSKGLVLPVKIAPKAAHHQICGWEGEELKIRLRAVPEKGKANEALIAFLAEQLNLSLSQIQIISGETSRHKRLLITHLSLKEGEARLAKILSSSAQ